MDYDKTDLAWAGGLFEGEGSISHHRYQGGLEYPQIVLAMTDEDVVRRFHAVLGGIGTITIRHPHTGGLAKLPLWIWNANSFEVSQAMIAMVWPHLGSRRRARAVDVLTIVRESQIHRKTMRRGIECSEPDCSNPVLAKGLCRSHYTAAKYAARRDTPCVIEGCTRRPNGSKGRCRAHTKLGTPSAV